MLKALFPYFNELPIIYALVQQQRNFSNCAVYAIAFATTIHFKDDPTKIVYGYRDNKMRKHLLNMIETDSLSRFPHIKTTSVCTMIINQNRKPINNT